MARLRLVDDTQARRWDVELWMTPDRRWAAPAVAAAMAIDLDFDLETVDDVRMATDEVCAELAGLAVPTARMHCGFDLEPTCLGVTVEVAVAERPRPVRDPVTVGVWLQAHSVTQQWTAFLERPGGIVRTTFHVDSQAGGC